MKYRIPVIIFFSIIILLLIIFGYLAWQEDRPSEARDNINRLLSSKTQEEPFYLASMTHLEGSWTMTASNEGFFSSQAEKLRYAMDLAEKYGATLTFETEKPFAQGMVRFDDNVFKEALERGHGIGTHCDTTPGREYSKIEMVEEAKERKQLVDMLTGEENNLGCSGLAGYSDWYTGATQAGFLYLDGIVGAHYLAIDPEDRPEGWKSNDIIYDEHFHDPAPVEEEKRYYPFFVSDTSFMEDSGGDLLISPGTLGSLRSLAEIENSDTWQAPCGLECPLTKDDVDAAARTIRAFNRSRDTSRISKMDVYLPTELFEIENQDVLEYFFKTMQQLEKKGTVEWATQKEVYESVKQK